MKLHRWSDYFSLCFEENKINYVLRFTFLQCTPGLRSFWANLLLPSTDPNQFHRQSSFFFFFLPQDKTLIEFHWIYPVPIMMCDAIQTRWAGSSPLHVKPARRNSHVCLKHAFSAPTQSPTTLSYLPQSALLGLMALDRIIPKEWFVLYKVHIWGPAETWEQHIISCMKINCVMEEKTDPDWETTWIQTVSMKIQSF